MGEELVEGSDWRSLRLRAIGWTAAAAVGLTLWGLLGLAVWTLTH